MSFNLRSREIPQNKFGDQGIVSDTANIMTPSNKKSATENKDHRQSFEDGDEVDSKSEGKDTPPYIPTIRIAGHSFNQAVLVTHVNIFLYSCCFWIQTSVFPYLSKQLGADPVTFGYLQTTFAVVQLAGGPLFGQFGDLFGSRNALVIAFIASGSTYFFLYLSTNLTLLFLSRLPSVFMHAMQGGQMVVTDVCATDQRAAALAKLGLSYGLGMVVGPIIGGTIAKLLGLEMGALVAALGSVLSVVLSYLFIPAKVKHIKTSDDSGNVFSLKKILVLLAAPGAFFLMAIKLATGIPIGIFQSMFSIVALDTFKLPPEQNSYIMSYIGIMAMIVQGVGVGFATKRFTELAILLGSALILAFAYFCLSFVTTIIQMCVVLIPMVIGLTFQNVITTSALTHTVSSADTGAMLGLSMAVNSLIRSLSPTVGGYMLENFGFQSFGYLGFITSSIVAVVLVIKKSRHNS